MCRRQLAVEGKAELEDAPADNSGSDGYETDLADGISGGEEALDEAAEENPEELGLAEVATGLPLAGVDSGAGGEQTLKN
jgi:hypothetical protein